MKKVFLLFALLVSVASSAIAVPPGAYASLKRDGNYGRTRVIVHQGGREVYLIDDNGKRYATLSVESETPSPEEPGVTIFKLRSVDAPVEQVYHRNAYWVDDDGNVKLNLEFISSILTRE